MLVVQVKSLGVDTSFISMLPQYATCTVDVFLKDGQPDYTIYENVAFDFIPVPQAEHFSDTNFDVYYFGTLAQRNHQASAVSLKHILRTQKFREIFFDINIRKSFYTKKKVIEFSLNRCTILKINHEEAEMLGPILWYRTIFGY